MRAPLEYSGAIREAIHAFKYRGKTARAPELASILRAYLISANEARVIPWGNLKLIVPVPLHSWRQWRRGYNQSTLLARELALQLHKEQSTKVSLTNGGQNPIVVAEVLRRVRHTVPQVELHKGERAANIKGAFALDEEKWRQYSDVAGSGENGGAVLILDDVTTTGATLFECARVLTELTALKPEQIFALTLARAL